MQLLRACESGDFVGLYRLLNELRAKKSYAFEAQVAIALAFAVQKGQMAVLEELLKENLDSFFVIGALGEATKLHNIEMAKLLLKKVSRKSKTVMRYLWDILKRSVANHEDIEGFIPELCERMGIPVWVVQLMIQCKNNSIKRDLLMKLDELDLPVLKALFQYARDINSRDLTVWTGRVVQSRYSSDQFKLMVLQS